MKRLWSAAILGLGMVVGTAANPLGVGLLLAQAGTPEAAADTATQQAGVPLTQMLIDQGGWPAVVIAALLAVGLFLTVFFLFTLRLGALFPGHLRMDAEQAAEQGETVKDAAEALSLVCQDDHSAAAEIIGAAARTLAEDPKAEYLLLRDVIEDEGSRRSSLLWQRTQYLMDIAVVAPMVGLLGTVLGMINAFLGLRDQLGGVRPEQLSAGVSQALITTAAGLVVGILFMMLHSYFRGRVGALVSQMESGCSDILQRLIIRRSTQQPESAR